MEWSGGSFLDRLAEPVREELLRLGATRTLPPGKRIFRQGGTDDHVEVIRRGFVKVTVADGHPERLVAVRLPGDIVGEFAAISGADRSATVTACGEVVSTVVSGREFRAFLARRPEAAAELTVEVGKRLRWSNVRRADFTTHPVDVRLARVLADLAEWAGVPARGGGVLIGVELSQPELAELIGAAEDSVQKALRTLRTAGLVRTGYRRVSVLDIERLRSHPGA
ncbi:Crp/Fnr family transcriptional regulator [Actinoplanes siamensis]|uniref:Cyclic nucleotide-binding protein n=1 Tax=Actinoplanes siamensis TaxID=1223317 RepID=A0A919N6F3_9ACTN|nr:Crp/Fnr family transcriptional regulator [Actinoplanes siamensis]GIF05191.1 cyclic nucleotide-binding protein [Actinoplanes siamensis]